MFLVYKQPKKIEDADHGHLTNRSGANRGNFKISKFATKHGLGNPIAGNFYQVISKSDNIRLILGVHVRYEALIYFIGRRTLFGFQAQYDDYVPKLYEQLSGWWL